VPRTTGVSLKIFGASTNIDRASERVGARWRWRDCWRFRVPVGDHADVLPLKFLYCNKLLERTRLDTWNDAGRRSDPLETSTAILHQDRSAMGAFLGFRVPHEDHLRRHFGFDAMCSDALRCAGIRSSRGFLGRFHGDNKSLRLPARLLPTSFGYLPDSSEVITLGIQSRHEPYR
jgi:hypothetical protein